MRAVVTGASGFIGGELVRRLIASGYETSGVARRDPGIQGLRFIHGSLGEAFSPEAIRDLDLVVHAAHDFRDGSYSRNVDGTLRWFSQARESGAGVQILISSVSAHRDAPSEYGRAKQALELHFVDAGGIVLRAGLVVGRGGSFGRLSTFLRRHAVVPVIGDSRMRVLVTDIGTLASVVLGFRTLRHGGVYNLFQPEPVPLPDLAREIRRAYGVRGMVCPVPGPVVKPMLRLARTIRFPLPMSYESFLALEQSQTYGYESSYGPLGLSSRPLSELILTTCT